MILLKMNGYNGVVIVVFVYGTIAHYNIERSS